MTKKILTVMGFKEVNGNWVRKMVDESREEGHSWIMAKKVNFLDAQFGEEIRIFHSDEKGIPWVGVEDSISLGEFLLWLDEEK